MAGIIALSAFAVFLIFCLIFNIQILYSLLAGYFIFLTYGIYEGHSVSKLLKMSAKGILKIKNIVMVFMLLGIITAIWRAAGTIPAIIVIGSKLIVPQIFLLLSFLLCSFLSVMIGSAFGTAATMGVICISIARVMGINELHAGGAILSGIFFGDRCSPMSTSAILVSEITETDLFENIRGMIKTSIVPFILSCIFYLLLGLASKTENIETDVTALFYRHYNLNIITIVPAALIIVLSVFKVRVKKTMIISIIASLAAALFIQKESIVNLLRFAVLGYKTSSEELNAMMSGGGAISMVKVCFIVAISSAYAGIFEETEILSLLKKCTKVIAEKISSFGAVLVTSIAAGAVTCNQTLGSILTYQLCRDLMPKEKMAISLENSSIIVVALIPWAIAMSVPLEILNVSGKAGLFAFYLYSIPIWNLIWSFKIKNKNKFYTLLTLQFLKI